MNLSLRHLLGWMVSAFRSRGDLVFENLALRRQLLALHAQQPRRRLTALHKLSKQGIPRKFARSLATPEGTSAVANPQFCRWPSGCQEWKCPR